MTFLIAMVHTRYTRNTDWLHFNSYMYMQSDRISSHANFIKAKQGWVGIVEDADAA